MTRTTLLTAAALLALAPAAAQAKNFNAELNGAIYGPVKIEVVLSEDLAFRAENMPVKLSDRSGARSPRAGFAGNGFYGQQALDELIEETRDEFTHDFQKRGVAVSETAATVVRVTLEDVKNNRPTYRQLSVQPNLDFHSFGLGGAELSAEIIGAGGETLGTMDYRWYGTLDSSRIHGGYNSVGSIGHPAVWGDANRAISRFASKASRKVAGAGKTASMETTLDKDLFGRAGDLGLRSGL